MLLDDLEFAARTGNEKLHSHLLQKLICRGDQPSHNSAKSPLTADHHATFLRQRYDILIIICNAESGSPPMPTLAPVLAFDSPAGSASVFVPASAAPSEPYHHL